MADTHTSGRTIRGDVRTGAVRTVCRAASIVGLLSAVGGVLALLGGCESDRGDAVRDGRSTLGAADFRGADAGTAVKESGGGEVVRPTVPALKVISPEQAREGMNDVTLLAGDPPKPGAVVSGKTGTGVGTLAAGSPLLVDALVGQINGKPVYASKFLGPLDGRLRAKVKELPSNRAWQVEAGKIIYDELISQVRDELFLAEARAALSPEQRKGLLAFVERLRENIASQNFGSVELAEEKSRQEEGVTLDKKVSDERDKALIRSLVGQQVAPRVNVSWKDVQRQYERDSRVYNPPPVAMIRMVWVDAKNETAAKRVAEKLASDSTSAGFASVAKSELNDFARSEGGLIERPFEPPYGSGRLWEDPTLNGEAHKLTAGATTGPFEYRGSKVWMHLETIRQEPGRSLEEVQLEIQNKIRNERFNDETGRFFQRILERGSRTNVREMTERLLLIASERYLVAERAQGTGPGAGAGAGGGGGK